MGKQFEFRLIGADAPDGELPADHLLAIVQSLKDVANRIARAETDAEVRGRAPQRVKRVGSLVIGMEPGSTRILARRAGAAGSLDFEVTDEQAFDEKFEALVESVARDHRPAWAGDNLASAAADLAAALQQAASEVEFRVNGQVRISFKTSDIHREVWRVAPAESPEPVVFIGRLYAVNLHTHRLMVEDDVGHQVALPDVVDDSSAGRLLGAYVTVTGGRELDAKGQLTHIRDATIEAAPNAPGGIPLATIPLDDILAGAPGIETGGIEGLTDAEADAFFSAMGLE